MNTGELKRRTKEFSLSIIKLVGCLPKQTCAEVIGKQILRSGTSVGANYRAASRARSKADFISKMGIVEEECDETIFWMELLSESGISKAENLKPIVDEANEILAMTVSSIITAKKSR